MNATRIRQRFWFDRTAHNRTSAYGPVISDATRAPAAGPVRAYALRWVGHQVSDEITALLQAAAAENVEQFRAAMVEYSLPGQNFLVADGAGNIAHVIASHLPVRSWDITRELLSTPAQSDANWQAIAKANNLPAIVNPLAGYLASANNRPSESAFPIGLFFGSDERIRRIQTLLESKDKITLADLVDMQTDVVSPLSREVRDDIAVRITPALEDRLRQTFAADPDFPTIYRAWQDWDGSYTIESRGALVFEAMLPAFAETIAAHVAPQYLSSDRQYNMVRDQLRILLPDTPQDVLEQALQTGFRQALTLWHDHKNWGSVHRMNVQHILGRIPYVGQRYHVDSFAVPGSRQTIWKSAHGDVTGPHNASFGSQSRHISDLADINANHFVLLGGQDGWINSQNYVDQVPLWREGTYITLPLAMAEVHAAMPIKTRLNPAAAPEGT